MPHSYPTRRSSRLCFTCSKDIFAASRIAGALAALGYAVLRFDFTGLGASEGEFANTGFSSNVADLLKAADYLRAERRAPAILIGHSLRSEEHTSELQSLMRNSNTVFCSEKK